MLVYGIIVGAGVKHGMSQIIDNTRIPLMYHPKSKDTNLRSIESQGLYRLGSIDGRDGSYSTYKFNYEDYLSFLVKHTDADYYEDISLNKIEDTDKFLDKYSNESISMERLAYTMHKEETGKYRFNKVRTSLYKESHHIWINNIDLEKQAVLWGHSRGYYTRTLPIWAVCLDIEEGQPREWVDNNDCPRIQERYDLKDVVDMSPTSILLHLIHDELDKIDGVDDNSIKVDLKRIEEIADDYEKEEDIELILKRLGDVLDTYDIEEESLEDTVERLKNILDDYDQEELELKEKIQTWDLSMY